MTNLHLSLLPPPTPSEPVEISNATDAARGHGAAIGNRCAWWVRTHGGSAGCGAAVRR